MLEITRIRHSWPEKAGFSLERPMGYPEYTFLHFFNSVEVLIDGKMVRTKPHACVLYRIGTPQKIISNQNLIHDWIHFTGELDEYFTQYGLQYDRLYYPANQEQITEMVRELEFEVYSSKPYSQELIQAKTRELFIKLSRACSEEYVTVVDSGTNARFRSLREQVFSNMREHWTVEKMAEQVNLSKSRFFTIYKSIYGNSPVDDLIQARIDSAKNALRFSTLPISEIAENLGYNNLTHFMRQFKGMTGMTPDQYRKSES